MMLIGGKIFSQKTFVLTCTSPQDENDPDPLQHSDDIDTDPLQEWAENLVQIYKKRKKNKCPLKLL